MSKKPVKTERKAKRPWIGGWIAEYLEKTGTTQDEIAQEWGRDQTLISKIIKGRADLDPKLWQSLSDKIGVSLDFFFNGPPENFEGLLLSRSNSVTEKLPYIRDYNPGEYAAEAWRIIQEAAAEARIDLLASIIKEPLALLFETTANGAAQGPSEEGRRRLVQKAKDSFQRMKQEGLVAQPAHDDR